MNMRLSKIIIIVMVILLLVPIYGCSEDKQVIIDQQEDMRIYKLEDTTPQYGMVFYVGTLIEPYKYDNIMTAIAKEGYLVVIPQHLANIAMSNTSAMDVVIDKFPNVDFIIGGHSLGGISLNIYVNENPNNVHGIVYYASHPGVSPNELKIELPLLSIIASNDGVMDMDDMLNNQYYPEDTTFYTIEGGNHNSFATDFNISSVPFFFEDGELEILIESQQEQAAQETIKFLNRVFN